MAFLEPLALRLCPTAVETTAAPTVAGVSCRCRLGTATVAAFVGAGGLGERIVAGLAVNDTDRMLAGAVPAAVLALVERVLVPAPLRAKRQRTNA